MTQQMQQQQRTLQLRLQLRQPPRSMSRVQPCLAECSPCWEEEILRPQRAKKQERRGLSGCL